MAIIVKTAENAEEIERLVKLGNDAAARVSALMLEVSSTGQFPADIVEQQKQIIAMQQEALDGLAKYAKT